MSQRYEQITALSAARARDLEQLVASRLVGVSHDVVEGACAFAWDAGHHSRRRRPATGAPSTGWPRPRDARPGDSAARTSARAARAVAATLTPTRTQLSGTQPDPAPGPPELAEARSVLRLLEELSPLRRTSPAEAAALTLSCRESPPADHRGQPA